MLHPQPLEYDYNDFERLLLGIAWHVYVTKKKGEAFEEVRSGPSINGVLVIALCTPNSLPATHISFGRLRSGNE